METSLNPSPVRAGIIYKLAELRSYPYCGRSSLMGGAIRPWQMWEWGTLFLDELGTNGMELNHLLLGHPIPAKMLPGLFLFSLQRINLVAEEMQPILFQRLHRFLGFIDANDYDRLTAFSPTEEGIAIMNINIGLFQRLEHRP